MTAPSAADIVDVIRLLRQALRPSAGTHPNTPKNTRSSNP